MASGPAPAPVRHSYLPARNPSNNLNNALCVFFVALEFRELRDIAAYFLLKSSLPLDVFSSLRCLDLRITCTPVRVQHKQRFHVHLIGQLTMTTSLNIAPNHK